jgi:PadR family transcriptional regulator AphA
MEYTLVDINAHPYIECLPDGGLLASEQDVLDLVAACGENDTDLLMLHVENLPEDFFRLSSGLLGAVLLKFNNYRIRAAAVIPPERLSGRFAEFAVETNWGSEFRVYATRAEAELWLTGDS